MWDNNKDVEFGTQTEIFREIPSLDPQFKF